MAKGNLFLGQARGKLGSMVFSVRKGVQIERVRNTSPANPKTPAQVAQRMKMYTPTRIYREATQNFFKFAFKKRSGETDFNAFMRENVALAPYASKQLVASQVLPLAPVKMSAGGVPGFNVEFLYSYADFQDLDLSPFNAYALVSEYDEGEDARIVRYLFASYSDAGIDATNGWTLGLFTRWIQYLRPDLRDGDKLTFVVIASTQMELVDGGVGVDPNGVSMFVHSSIVLDSTSTAPIDWIDDVQGEVHIFEKTFKVPMSQHTSVGAAVIVTRSNGNQVDASNSVLSLDYYAQGIYDVMSSDAYQNKAAKSYQVTEQAPLNPSV